MNFPPLEKEDDWASFMAETAVLSEDWPPKYFSHQWSFRILFRRIYWRMITAVREWVWSYASAAPCFVFYRSDESVNIGIVSVILVLDHCDGISVLLWQDEPQENELEHQCLLFNVRISDLAGSRCPLQHNQVRHPCSPLALSYPKRYKELLWGLRVLSYVEIVPPSPWYLGRTGRRRRRSRRSRGTRGAPRPGGEGGHWKNM